MNTDPRAKTEALIRKHFPRARSMKELPDDTHLKEMLFGNDLDTLGVVMDIEDELNIEITDEEDEQLHTVGDFHRLVAAKLGAGA